MTENEKPSVPPVEVPGTVDGNVFAVMGTCIRALKKAERVEDSKIMQQRVLKAKSYDEALSIMQEYCTFTGE